MPPAAKPKKTVKPAISSTCETPSEQTAQLATPEALGKWIDELGSLEEELAPHQNKLKRVTALRKLISDNCGLAAEKSEPFHGKQYTALISARENQRKITSIAKVFGVAGKAAFLKVCSLTLKAFEEIVPAAQQDGLIETARTGPRDVKTYRNPAAADRAA